MQLEALKQNPAFTQGLAFQQLPAHVSVLCLQAVGLQPSNTLLCLQAMGLQQLVHNLLPTAPILGSSLPSDAWGTPAFVRRSLRGAVFLGSKAYDEGVAGCLLHGPLQVGGLTAELSANSTRDGHICALPGRAGKTLSSTPLVLHPQWVRMRVCCCLQLTDDHLACA